MKIFPRMAEEGKKARSNDIIPPLGLVLAGKWGSAAGRYEEVGGNWRVFLRFVWLRPLLPWLS